VLNFGYSESVDKRYSIWVPLELLEVRLKISVKVLLRMMRVALTPRGWLLKTKLSNGAVIYGKNYAGFGGRGVYVYRDSIEPEFQYLESFLDSTGVFVDVGASTGIYSIKAAKHFGNNGVVLAIEPFLGVLPTLHHSIQANGFTNVRLRNFCVSDRTGVRIFWRNFGKPNSFSLIKRDPSASPLSILTVSLDDLFKWEGLNRLDYLKIDVEGAEQEVLIGAKRVIEEHRPIIQIEVSIVNFPVQLVDYSIFHAPHSPNKVCIPNENSKIEVPKHLGWTQIAN
jgi:FkbM family methyltransferase